MRRGELRKNSKSNIIYLKKSRKPQSETGNLLYTEMHEKNEAAVVLSMSWFILSIFFKSTFVTGEALAAADILPFVGAVYFCWCPCSWIV
jgi:hypothetical protein